MKKRIVLLMSFLVFFNCTSTKTDDVVRIAKGLSRSFSSFANIVTVIDLLTTQITTNTRKQLTTKINQDTYVNVSREWEKTWKKIENNVYKLEKEYNNIRKESFVYLAKLKELERNTTDDNLRAEMNRKTTHKTNEFNIESTPKSL